MKKPSDASGIDPTRKFLQEKYAMDRRRFMAKLAVAAGSTVLGGSYLRAQTGPAPPSNVRLISTPQQPPYTAGSGPKPLLGQGDFTYEGYYEVQTAGGESPYGQCLTHRYVNGQIRFLTVDWNRYVGPIGDTGYTRLSEFSIAGLGYGAPANVTRRWQDIWGSPYAMQGQYFGIWWDEAKQRLWSTHAVDYNNVYIPTQIHLRTLNDNGTISNLHKVSLQGIPDRRVQGGAQAVPAWFQSAYGVGPYVVGWGGYTSLVSQGGVSSMGPTAYAIPDPGNYASGAVIPTGTFRTLADHSSGSRTTDWWHGVSGASATSNGFDRGVRCTLNFQNYFDANDPRQNPPTPPTVPPTPGNWDGAAPDGLGRWSWADIHLNTGCWIDGPTKHGFLLIPSLGGGKLWYGNSSGHIDYRVFEFHVFDPIRFGEAINGSRPAWRVRPTNLWEEKFAGMGNRAFDGGVPGSIGGATYDSTTKKLYVLGLMATTYTNRLYVYNVNA